MECYNVAGAVIGAFDMIDCLMKRVAAKEIVESVNFVCLLFAVLCVTECFEELLFLSCAILFERGLLWRMRGLPFVVVISIFYRVLIINRGRGSG